MNENKRKEKESLYIFLFTICDLICIACSIMLHIVSNLALFVMPRASCKYTTEVKSFEVQKSNVDVKYMLVNFGGKKSAFYLIT